MLIVGLFFVCGVGLIVLAAIETWNALQSGAVLEIRERFELIFECVDLLTITVVSLSIECLIGVFQFMHGSPEYLLHSAAVGVAAAAILATRGLFVRMNVAAEKLEPRSMHDVQREDEERKT